ncbi:hypothetical protein [Micrococcus luteus]|uniref:hypothetical protein n=1 Tax=Micrococcus luteus TaxID=1270 RepID=UPI000DFD7697|nr:hypothetical protein [Micrococcus luteus]STY68054.1 Uncharacterised protein [Micrococcus luteus]
MTKKTLPDWHAMTPQELADLRVADEGAWWVLYTAGWGDPAWHYFSDQAAKLAPREGVTLRASVSHLLASGSTDVGSTRISFAASLGLAD